jgi:6-phosphogluconolactonase
VDRKLLQEIDNAAVNNECLDRFKGKTTLTLIQSIKTVPSAFSTTMNTCGRICVHKNGRFVIVSNRGHESLAIFRVKSNGPQRGQLSIVGYFHTRGETPRHFQFDSSGQFLIVANQDTDSISVFTFNMSSGEIKFTGNEYRVPSPNFVCSCPVRGVDNLMASIHPAYNRVSSVQGVNTIMRSENRVVESDLEESDGSTMTVDDAEVLQKQLQEALQQVEDLKFKLTRMTCGSADSKN